MASASGALLKDYVVRFICLVLWCALSACEPRVDHPNKQHLSSKTMLRNASDTVERRLYIYAASSLERFVSMINDRYKQRYPNVKFIVSLVGSQTARIQIERGAPPGIFISADPRHIKALHHEGKLSMFKPLAINRLSLITRSKSAVLTFEDLERGEGFAIGAPGVPVGDYAWALLRAYYRQEEKGLKRISNHIKTQAMSARALKARLRRGEVDSAFIYQSDLFDLEGVRQVKIPDELASLREVKILISLTRHSADQSSSEVARQWYQLATGKVGDLAICSAGLIPLTARNESQPQHSQRCESPQLLK